MMKNTFILEYYKEILYFAVTEIVCHDTYKGMMYTGFNKLCYFSLVYKKSM
jgi:hypothetical protein